MAELIGLDTIRSIYNRVLKTGCKGLAQEITLDGYYKIYYISYDLAPVSGQEIVCWNKIGYLIPGAL